MRNNFKVSTHAVSTLHHRREEFATIATGYQKSNQLDVERALRWAAKQAEKLPVPSPETT